jgi:HAD superfamily hydrolase (TIGR01484 family)
VDSDLPIKLISTDFDGTLFAEFENPPIPEEVQRLIGSLQDRGAKWVINTGRDMSSLMEALGRAGVEVEPDFLVLVEREIHFHQDSRYSGLEDWNAACARDHANVFARILPELPRIIEWINARFHARIYEDPYSPFCLIAHSNGDADLIHHYLTDFCRSIPELTVVRNDVYARFSHAAYNKGTALAEVSRLLGIQPQAVFAAGDHLNDLPMLSLKYAHRLAAPANSVEPVKTAVRDQNGFVSQHSHGAGVADAIKYYLEPTPA